VSARQPRRSVHGEPLEAYHREAPHHDYTPRSRVSVVSHSSRSVASSSTEAAEGDAPHHDYTPRRCDGPRLGPCQRAAVAIRGREGPGRAGRRAAANGAVNEKPSCVSPQGGRDLGAERRITRTRAGSCPTWLILLLLTP
jgi:hypothetical protein